MFRIGILAFALSALFFIGAVNDRCDSISASCQLIASALFFIAAVICFK